MNKNARTRKWGAGLPALLLIGSLAAGPLTACAADPPPKDKSAGKPAKKEDSIPIKIVPPIIVPDKSKDAPKPGK